MSSLRTNLSSWGRYLGQGPLKINFLVHRPALFVQYRITDFVKIAIKEKDAATWNHKNKNYNGKHRM
jgi:hypothetical protein